MSKSKKAEKTPDTKGKGKKDKDGIITVGVDSLYQDWFLDYASYVILERAVPRIEDGLKPVQRRILHAMREMEDGRFNKVANIIGQAMQYHPHGDAAIGEAIINLGQKDLLIETQGNWGDIRTGDSAAAPRYIEARLSKFALDVVFNPQTTEWQLSYDGRKKEPVTLPVKFPLLLAQGVEGIAVGLSTKILPHNFSELLKASIDILKGKNPKIYPDFPTGGIADVSEYDQGKKGGKIKIRAKIEIADKKTLIIREIPFSTTTSSLIESIVKASEKGQIKIRQVVDNTAQDVEIQIHLQPGQSPEIALEALYAFTDCEITISPNACVIVDEKPRFLGVNDILRYSTEQTVHLLKRELEIKRDELKEKILFSSLEKIFIENRIYRDIEECETWEDVIATIDRGLKPHKKKFYREITTEDIIRLTEIKIKRISRYDAFKADEMLRDLEKELKDTEHHLRNLTAFAISYFQNLLDKYGKGRERKTELKEFHTVAATEVIAANQKLYVNRADGFAGWGLKRDEYVCECSELDDIIAIRRDGKALVSRISEKVFMGKDILYIGIWKKGDDRMVYNLIYTDGKSGKSFAKRFAMPGVIRDKEYDLTQGNPQSRVLYVSGNPNGEAEVVEIKLSQGCAARKKVFEFDFADLEVKGRGARGNVVTKYPVRKVEKIREGTSTLSKLDLWYDPLAGRLNRDQRGYYLGKFDGEDRLIAFQTNGTYKITGYDLNTRFDPEKTLRVEKFNARKPVSAVYVDGHTKQYMVKRFMVETTTLDKEFHFISEAIGSRLVLASMRDNPEVEVEILKGKSKEKSIENINLEDFIDIKGWKALGNRLTPHKVVQVKWQQDDENVQHRDEEVNEDSAEIIPPKKKEGGNTAVQASLFEHPKNQNKQHAVSAPRKKEKAVQAKLFAEPGEPQNRESREGKDDLNEVIPDKKEGPSDSKNDRAYGIGETVELEL
jgi:topoisomerase-4 subunit A